MSNLVNQLRSMSTWDIDCNDMNLVGRKLEEAADEIEKLEKRVKFLDQHCDILVESLLAEIDKAVLPKFEEARTQILKMREATARKK